MKTDSGNLTHPKYRPDIDGLRAVAVLSVVGFHAFPALIRGGFVGVDIFFVISGFLISTIIFENLEKNTFSFAEFYMRRIKRIFPALLLVLAACFALGWVTLLADEYKQLGKHIAGGAGFISNFVLWKEAGYFDNSAETKPLLHLWSLGIEEQFYIVWPLLLWFTWKRKFNPFLVISFLVATSFFLNVKGVRTDAVATFYSPQTRFWELLCGSILAWLTIDKKSVLTSIKAKLNGWLGFIIYRRTPRADGAILAHMLSLAGFSLLTYGIYKISKDLSFPGQWALIPVLGAALTIAAGPSAFLNRTILSNRVLVWIGLISFPLYLWHWPLLSFARIVEGGILGGNTRIVAIFVAVALAWITHKLVEKPLRFGSHGVTKVILLSLVMLTLGYVGYNTYQRNGLSFRTAVKLNVTAQSGNDGGDEGNSINECGIEDGAQKRLYANCARDKRGIAKYALLGDSKAASLYAGLVRTSSDKGRWVLIGGNGANGGVIPIISEDPIYSHFQRLTVYAVKTIKNNKNIKTVVLATAARSLFQIRDIVVTGNVSFYNYKYMETLNASPNYKRAINGFENVVAQLVEAGKDVVILVDNPALPSAQDCISRRTSLRFVNAMLKDINPDCFMPLNRFVELTKTYRSLLTELQEKFPGKVTVFDTKHLMCDEEKQVCGPAHHGRLLYAYTDHISDYAAGRIGAQLNEYLNDGQARLGYR